MQKTILFISTMPGTPWGASEELWSQTALRLVKQGIPVAASVHGWPRLDQHISALSEAGVDVRPRPIKPSIITLARRYISGKQQIVMDVEKAFGNFSPSLVVISDGGSFPPVELVEMCIAKAWPFATVAHSNFESYWPADEDAARYRNSLRLAARCFFVSEANRALLEKQLGFKFDNTEIVRNPITVSTNSPTPWPATGVEQHLRLACVGRLYLAQKGQDILVEVLAKPRWAERNWHLTFYGDGPNRNGLERLIRMLHLSDRVTLAGYVAPDQIWPENHVSVMPSRYEGLPLTIVEAMLCGRPVVATNVAGNSEVVSDGITGFLAECAAVECFDKALERMWVHRDRLQEMGRVAAADARAFLPDDPIGIFAGKIKSLSMLRTTKALPS